MTMMRCILGTKETSILHHFRLKLVLNLPPSDQLQEFILIYNPVSFVTFKFLENIVGRCQQWLMDIVCATNLMQEIGKIFCFGEAGQLRCIV